MKIDLRIASADLGTVANMIFVPKKQFRMKLFPLPPVEWVGEQKCSLCGGTPAFLQEDFSPICRKCIDTLMKGITKKTVKQEASIPITWDIVTHTRFEWSTDGTKWYSIAGRNIKVTPQKLFLEELKKSIVEKKPMSVEADYEKETKTMTVSL
jgi:hypothetical protein